MLERKSEREKNWSKEEGTRGRKREEDREGMEKREMRGTANAEITSDGKYKCRECGQVFDTVEAHDEHHRKTHEQKREMPREEKAVERPRQM